MVKRQAAPDAGEKGSGGQSATREEGANADGTAWDFGDVKGGGVERTGDGYTVVRAKEETYAFKSEEELEQQRREMAKDNANHRFTVDANGNLVERKMTLEELNAINAARKRYRCTALKLHNNQLTSQGIQALPQVLATLAVSPFTALTVIDLSFNQLTSMPNLDGYPIHALLLHCNLIPSLKEAAKLQVLYRTLRKLTLNNNPLQDRTPKYKYAVLHQLPFLTFFDEVRVTDKDRERIAVFEGLFVDAKSRGTTRKFLPPLSSTPQPTSSASLNASPTRGL